MNIQKQIENYKPKSQQEVIDQKLILDFISKNDDFLYRTNLAAHLTSSAIVINDQMDHVLFAFHNIYQSWAWVGGHNDGNPNALHVAIKEAKEETGVKTIYPYHEDILMIDVIQVMNHIKNGQYVPDHLHLNLTFLLIASMNEPLKISVHENSDVKWIPISQVFNMINEPRMKPVYQKAFQEIENIRKQLNR
jgi:ADP-ribose pyrophosphatase YjhB (NUDIX family)